MLCCDKWNISITKWFVGILFSDISHSNSKSIVQRMYEMFYNPYNSRHMDWLCMRKECQIEKCQALALKTVHNKNNRFVAIVRRKFILQWYFLTEICSFSGTSRVFLMMKKFQYSLSAGILYNNRKIEIWKGNESSCIRMFSMRDWSCATAAVAAQL